MDLKQSEIVKKLAQKYKLPVPIVEKIVNSQFEFIKEVIKNSDITDHTTFKNVRLHKLGMFCVTPGRLNFIKTELNELRERKRARKSELS